MNKEEKAKKVIANFKLYTEMYKDPVSEQLKTVLNYIEELKKKVFEITEVKIRESFGVRDIAKVSITINNCFVVHDIIIFKCRNNELSIMMPYKRVNGDFKDIAHPINNETREQIKKIILDEYMKKTKKREVKE